MRKPGARISLVAVVGVGLLGSFAAGRLTPAGAAAHARSKPAARLAVTPGWECIPATAGEAVTSGGSGPSPSCASGTPVLAPTYVSSGVGGKPTVVFSSENVQIVSGSGATDGPVNGTGNLVVGYGENPGARTRTGSNNLVVGSGSGWTSYGALVGGNSNQANGAYSTVVGTKNTGAGPSSFVAGQHNKAGGHAASVLGGEGNTTTAGCQSIPAAPGVC